MAESGEIELILQQLESLVGNVLALTKEQASDHTDIGNIKVGLERISGQVSELRLSQAAGIGEARGRKASTGMLVTLAGILIALAALIVSVWGDTG